jgi:hypothetical protein
VLPTQLVPDNEGKYLRVRLIQKEGSKMFDPVYLFDEGSTISWIPCGRKLTCSFPGGQQQRVAPGVITEQRLASLWEPGVPGSGPLQLRCQQLVELAHSSLAHIQHLGACICTMCLTSAASPVAPPCSLSC